MKEAYDQSLQKIQGLKRIATVKEWNEMAKKENLLSSESLKYISRKNFAELCKEVRNR